MKRMQRTNNTHSRAPFTRDVLKVKVSPVHQYLKLSPERGRVSSPERGDAAEPPGVELFQMCWLHRPSDVPKAPDSGTPRS